MGNGGIQRQFGDNGRLHSTSHSVDSVESTVSSSFRTPPVPAPANTARKGLSMGEILFSSPPAHSLPLNDGAPPQQEEIEPASRRSSQLMKAATVSAGGGGIEEKIIDRVDNSFGRRKDSGHTFPVNVDSVESDNDRRRSVSRELNEEEQQKTTSSYQSHNNTTTTFSNTPGAGLELRRGSNSHAVPVTSSSTKISTSNNNTTTITSNSANVLEPTVANCKPEITSLHHSTGTSPTRIRDRQRKMELTLQHIQNNAEDRMNPSKKLHHNLDSHYPVSKPYIPKILDPNGSDRYRSPHHRSPVPPLREADELALLNEPSPPPPPPHGADTFSFLEESTKKKTMEQQQQPQPYHIKNFRAPVLNLCDEITCNKWILETMREEIRLENERMEDATKSLMMDEDFSTLGCGERRKGSNGVGEKTGESRQTSSSGTGLAGKSSYNYQSSKTTTKSHELDKLNNAETETSSSSSSSKVGEVESKDNTKISHANSTSGSSAQDLPGSHEGKTNFIPTEINPTGVVSDGSMEMHSRNPQGGGERGFSSSNGITCGGSNGGGGGGSAIPPATLVNRPILGERAHSYSSPGSGQQLPLMSGPPFRNTRSFSLRQQSSTDSVGSEDLMGSPDGSLPSLQRAMSCDSVSSDTSMTMSDFDPPHPTGYLCVGLEYDCETADLLVNVMEAKELVGPDPNSLAFDTYVRVYLLPDKTHNMQTRVYRKSLNPVYREKFMFGVETMELPLRTLVFYLFATDKFSNTLVGETEVKLGDLDIYQPITTWLQLTDTGQRGGESGEIMFSLAYLPTAERLTVVIVKARNLKFPHDRETGDPFVKVYLLQKGKKVSKKKSSTKRGEKNPIFNEAMIFSVPAHALQTIQLRITVADTREADGRANSMGHIIVGSSASGSALNHWNTMLASLRKPVAMWHPLRK
ncbi:synaptotagmin-like protein 5 [Folsomia candida]|nr:synaptotagmin-like protein 5 [Folsomia candida]